MNTQYSDLLFKLALVNKCFIVNLVKFNFILRFEVTECRPDNDGFSKNAGFGYQNIIIPLFL